MRWPIQFQFLLAMLLIVIAAIVLASAASALWAVSAAGQSKAEELSRVQRTLVQASFPLTESVLEQMTGLSGAEFVLLDADRRVIHGTIALDAADRAVLRAAPLAGAIQSLAEAFAIELGGRGYFAQIVPAARATPTSPGRFLAVLYGRDQWSTVARRAAAPVVGSGAIAVLLAIGLATLTAGRLVRPIQALRTQTERIAEGQFEPLAAAARNDELADLADSINQMAERISRYEREVRRNEQLRMLGQLGAGMAHRLRNAATGARLAVELHKRRNPAAADSESLSTALHELALMESYVVRFLHLGQKGAVSMAAVDLNQVVTEAVGLVRPAFDHAQVRLEPELPEATVRVRGEPDSLRELVLNLLLNAMEAVAAAADRRVVLELETPDNGNVEVRVSDSGPGPDPAFGERMFEPFVSEKPEGTGLGLYLSRQIAEAHGGSIRWERRDGLTRFIVRLPRLTQTENDIQTRTEP
ncbi:MAG: HAMP domain-containing histidine kinase [Pirellulaceae bacterium]|jgi:signal transduction histidine kinase|nr:HAMP domain-containing sensor histidine kinase [Thermoguttaceae bacterium]MDI9445013.1 HAMP domain-containing sensor histidine kinase [Planctomycetota bacterium]NLY99227.1 HAMP domain-containing histidine kinase [Pirellulaceae bacterium]